MKDLLKLVLETALEAGNEIMKIYASADFGVTSKEDDSPITIADVAAHNLIFAQLKTTGIPVLSEEGRSIPFAERKDWSEMWIVDPIDGTKEFISRNGEFTVNIALVRNHKVVLSVVYAPAVHELYYCEESIGSYYLKLDKEISIEEIMTKAARLPLSVNLPAYTVLVSRSHLTKETTEYISSLEKAKGKIDTIAKGSSLKLCWVAAGLANCYPRFSPTMEWDTAAGHGICSYAGVKVIDLATNEELQYNRAILTNNSFMVS